MLKKRISRRLAALVIGVVAGGVLTGGVIAGQFRESPSPDLEAALRDDPLVKVADIPAQPGLAGRGVFVQSTSAGYLCLWDAMSETSPTRQGGCNPADDPLTGRKLSASFAYEGGPAVEDVKDARLIGLASLDVAAVEIVMSDGSRRSLKLRKVPREVGAFNAFGQRLSHSELRHGVTPTAVVALDASGAEIGRQATGF